MRKNILGETSLYQSIGKITRKWEDCGVMSYLWKISGSYSKEMLWMIYKKVLKLWNIILDHFLISLYAETLLIMIIQSLPIALKNRQNLSNQ